MGLWPSTWWASSPAPPPPPPPPPPPTSVALQAPPKSQIITDHRDPSITPSQRLRKQMSLYLAGATFLIFSIGIARRSTRRRNLSMVPQYYTPNTRQSELNFNGGIDALEALNIATLGVLSVGMMTVGGAMYAFDVVNVEETRRLVRSRYGWEGRKSEDEVEEELEEWVATVLARKEKKEKERERR